MKALPVKIQTIQGSQRFGIVVTSFAELLKKGRQKLNIPPNCKNLRVCLEDDGTDVDDSFLQQIVPHSVLVFLQPGDHWMGYWSYVINAFDQVKKIHPLFQVKEKIEETLSLSTDNAKLSTISIFLTALDRKGHLEDREQDPDWFEG